MASRTVIRACVGRPQDGPHKAIQHADGARGADAAPGYAAGAVRVACELHVAVGLPRCMWHGALTSGTQRTVEGVLLLMQPLAAQLCQIHDWTLNDAPPQPGLRTIRHGDTVLINGDDESEAPFIGVVHQVSSAANRLPTDPERFTANALLPRHHSQRVADMHCTDACPRHPRSCHVRRMDVCCGSGQP